MAWVTVEGWAGRVWVADNGKRTFYIRQYRDGKPWEVSTKCSRLPGALKELDRFEKDPAGYRPQGVGEQLVLDEQLITRYRAWCEDTARQDGKELDPRWLDAKERYLGWWAEQLKGRPLGAVKLSRILELLVGTTSRRDRTVSIKHLYSYLRQTDQLAAAEDPTLDALPVAQSKPEQDSTGESKVIPEADFRAALPHLDPVFADACWMMAGTGCHLSEVIRYIKLGVCEEGQVLGFRHKGGHIHRVRVALPTWEAAKRLKAQAWAPSRKAFYDAINKACGAAKVEPWTPGRFRHTFATTAIASGVDPEAVARALGHKCSATTLRWYATTAVVQGAQGGYL
jgi:integrase